MSNASADREKNNFQQRIKSYWTKNLFLQLDLISLLLQIHPRPQTSLKTFFVETGMSVPTPNPAFLLLHVVCILLSRCLKLPRVFGVFSLFPVEIFRHNFFSLVIPQFIKISIYRIDVQLRKRHCIFYCLAMYFSQSLIIMGVLLYTNCVVAVFDSLVDFFHSDYSSEFVYRV